LNPVKNYKRIIFTGHKLLISSNNKQNFLKIYNIGIFTECN
jgi:hypothetical protein